MTVLLKSFKTLNTKCQINDKIYLVFQKGRNGCTCVCVRERDRQTDRETKDSDCYHWHRVGGQTFRALLLLPNRKPPHYGGSAKDSLFSIIAGYFPNLTESLRTNLWMNLLSLDNFLNTYTFSFWFSIHVIYFRSPIVYIVVRNHVYEISK